MAKQAFLLKLWWSKIKPPQIRHFYSTYEKVYVPVAGNVCSSVVSTEAFARLNRS